MLGAFLLSLLSVGAPSMAGDTQNVAALTRSDEDRLAKQRAAVE